VSGIKLVHELLGHKDITTTIRYAHLSPNMGQDAVALLDNNASHEATTRQQDEK
jgi:site-specific recombinase XerD